MDPRRQHSRTKERRNTKPWFEETKEMATCPSSKFEDVTPECELIYEEGLDSQQLFEGCVKNPGHPKFIPANEFSMKDLPEEIRTNEVFDLVKIYIERTVKVVVKYTSPNRPDNYPSTDVPYPYSDVRGNDDVIRVGTGVMSIGRTWQFQPSPTPFEYVKGQPCPCFECKDNDNNSSNPKMEYVVVIVTTATHVIYDELEAKMAQFELFYDSEENKDNMKFLYGIDLSYSRIKGSEKVARSQTDRVRVKCVSHDPELIQILKKMEPKMHSEIYSNIRPNFGIIVSHPHGRSKRVTIGNILSKDFPTPCQDNGLDKPDLSSCYTFGPGTKCRMYYQNPTHAIYQLFEKFAGSSATNPGDEIVLEKGFLVWIPGDSSYLCRYNSLYGGWISFTPGAKFSSNEGEDWYVLPGVEIELDVTNTDMPLQQIESGFLIYDMNTCPGSSGAPVLYSDRRTHCVYHSGTIQQGASRSTVIHFCS